MSQSLPPAAALVAHRVADYTAWKRVFDETKQFRIDDGILGHDVHRGADDPNMVYVYCPAGDVDKLVAHAQKAELKEIMQKAGVEGKPDLWLMKPMSADFIPDRKLPGMVTVHDVEDYAAWRKTYDELDAHRKQNGIVGHAVNQELGNPNRLIVYQQAEEMDTLRQRAGSAELRDAMQRAGVVGEPSVHLIEPLEIVEY